MTNGDYVFFFMQPMILPSFFSDFTWKLNKDDDSVALKAFPVVLYLITDTETVAKNIPVQTLTDIMTQLRSFRACQNYTTAPVDALAAYGAVTLLAKVAHDLVQNSHNQVVKRQFNLGGTSFVHELSNHTHNLPLESMAFDENGNKIPNFLIKQFNSTSASFENVVFFHGKSLVMSTPFGQNVTWPGGHLPDNEPRCGFDGLRDECLSSRAISLASIISVVAITLLGLAAAALCFRWTNKRSIARKALLSCDDLVLGTRDSLLR